MRLDPKEVQLIEDLRRAPDGKLELVLVKLGKRIRQAVFKKENPQVIDKNVQKVITLPH